jgi:hypothetical protein
LLSNCISRVKQRRQQTEQTYDVEAMLTQLNAGSQWFKTLKNLKLLKTYNNDKLAAHLHLVDGNHE